MCNHTRTKVLERRDAAGGLTRRRQCCACGLRFTTYGDGPRETPVAANNGGRRSAPVVLALLALLAAGLVS